MLYDLSNQLDRERFKTRSNSLYAKGKIVELTEKHDKRSLSQNNYLHLILSFFAIETGNQLEYVKREYFKKICNSDLFITYKDDPYLGCKVEVISSSTALDTAQMTTAIERFRNWASREAGIYLPEPNEEEFIKTINVEVGRNKFYL